MSRHNTALVVALVVAGLAGSTASSAAQSSEDALTLHRAIEISLAFHPSVRAAHARADDARARVGEAAARWWPTLGLEGTAFRFQEPMLVFPLHGFDTSAFRFDQTLLQGNVSLGWTLFDGGARGARIKGARAQEAAATDGGVSAEMTLVADVATAYLGVLSAEETLAAQSTSLDALESERDRVQQLLTEGQAARVELLRVEAALAQVEAERVTTAAHLEGAERALARLLGLEPDETHAARLRPVQLRDTTDTYERNELVRRFEATNPDLAAARQHRAAADWSRRAAIGAWFPQLDVVGRYLLFGSPDLDPRGEWQAGVRLSYPLFTGGARSRAVSGAAARAAVAREEEQLVRLRGEEAVDRGLTAVSETRSRAAAVETAVRHMSEVTRIEQLALAEGAGTQTDFLRADADLRRARAALAQARHAQILARIQLARAMGELTLQWLTATLETSP
jgi:outer membrane protein